MTTGNFSLALRLDCSRRPTPEGFSTAEPSDFVDPPPQHAFVSVSITNHTAQFRSNRSDTFCALSSVALLGKVHLDAGLHVPKSGIVSCEAMLFKPIPKKLMTLKYITYSTKALHTRLQSNCNFSLK